MGGFGAWKWKGKLFDARFWHRACFLQSLAINLQHHISWESYQFIYVPSHFHKAVYKVIPMYNLQESHNAFGFEDYFKSFAM